MKTLAKPRRRGYSLEHVLVVDDSPEKHVRNYGNLIAVRPFTGELEDRELLLLLPYLETLRDVENVRRIEKCHWRKSSPLGENERARTLPAEKENGIAGVESIQ